VYSGRRPSFPHKGTLLEGTLAREWSNWSGSVRFRPSRIEEPATEGELVAAVCRAAAENRSLRVVGALHSSSPIIRADDVLMTLGRMKGVAAVDRDSCEAEVLPGTTLKEAGDALREAHLAMHNLGDVDVQTVAGAVSTGTHGSGRRLGNLATMLVGGRLVTGSGEVVDFSDERDPDLVRAVRCSVGALGVLSRLRLRLVPAYRLDRREWCCRVDDCLANLDTLINGNRNFDFYWYPRSDEVKLRTHNPPGDGPERLPFATLLSQEEGWVDDVLASRRELRFDEIEYALPADAGPACFRELRERVKARHRRQVAWRVLYRTVAADDAYLSTAHGQETVTISAHHNAGLPYEDYFADAESIFRAHGGRPHWGKKHTLKAEDLRPLYPMWDRFHDVRRRLDPDAVFLSGPMRELLGTDRQQSKAQP
jgi:FAD/FMN-containing dehydrogenase